MALRVLHQQEGVHSGGGSDPCQLGWVGDAVGMWWSTQPRLGWEGFSIVMGSQMLGGVKRENWREEIKLGLGEMLMCPASFERNPSWVFAVLKHF